MISDRGFKYKFKSFWCKTIFCEIEKLTERLNDVVATNEKITSELLIVKNTNSNLEKRITIFEKLQAKAEQYNRANNVKISGFSNDILDNDLKKNLVWYVKTTILPLCRMI